MNVLEQRFMEAIPHQIAELVKQFRIANKLKALEIKANAAKNGGEVTPEMVDEAFGG